MFRTIVKCVAAACALAAAQPAELARWAKVVKDNRIEPQ